jgi:hypothetical protein
MDRKLKVAMLTYVGLAILAGFTLDGKIRLGTWLILGVFALKTWLVVLRRRMD